jgi:hypothetical protein
MEIDEGEEFSRDWDWYAVDLDQQIGHFTTAGIRSLPSSVKRDRCATEAVGVYFQELARTCGYSIRTAAEADAGGWKTVAIRARYLQSFTDMAARGLFSYNTQLVYNAEAKYYLVAVPECPLRLSDLPLNIRQMVSRTRASVCFGATEYISERETLRW